MRNLITILLMSICLFVSCDEEKNFEVLNTEAFAFSLDNGWELNASINVAGFQQNEDENENFSAKLSYYMHLVTPAKDTLFEADYGYIDKHEDEELMDIQIDSQMEIDSSFSSGSYTILFEVIDDYTQETIKASKAFDLTEE